jgi:hypothetical protein
MAQEPHQLGEQGGGGVGHGRSVEARRSRLQTIAIYCLTCCHCAVTLESSPFDEEPSMKLTMLGTVSDVGNSPTLYRTDRGTLVVQGWRVPDPEAIGARAVPSNEVLTEFPIDLLRFAPNALSEGGVANLTDEAFYALFDGFHTSGLRLESRAHTNVPDEQEEVRKFLAGQLSHDRVDLPKFWTDMLNHHAEHGRTLRRVRVMDDPLTDYNRYMIFSARRNVAAGEDIRFLPRRTANALDLPDHDFWVFDSVRLVELRFSADGRPLGHDLIVDAAIAARHYQWIEKAYAAATPWADYIAEDPSREAPPPRRLSAAT